MEQGRRGCTVADPIWRIGSPGDGPYQFSGAWTIEGTRSVFDHVVGISAATDWPAIHPGPLDAGADVEYVARIHFPCPPDSPAYDLSLELVASRGPCPPLEIDLNGHRGLWIIDPVRTDRTQAEYPSPIVGVAATTFRLPGAWMVTGDNVLSLSTVVLDEVDEAERRPAQPFFAPWHHFGSALTYRSLELRVPTAPGRDDADDHPVDARFTPLPLYQQRRDQELVELVDIVGRVRHGVEVMSAHLQVGDHRQRIELDLDGREFGDVRARVVVPALDAPVPATLTTYADGIEQRVNTTFVPARRWTLHLLPHVHLDVGYTDFQGKVFELHCRNIDRALDAADADGDYAFSIDGSLVVQHYLASRTPTACERLLGALRSGRFATNAFSAHFLTGLASLEECYRAAAGALRLRREHGVPVTYANLTDVPSYSWALPSVLADLGIEHFLGITNHGRAANPASDELHLRSPFRWTGPDGKEVVAYLSDGYAQLRFIGGDPPTVAGCADGLTRYVRRFDRDDYVPRDLPIMGIHADNEDLGETELAFVHRWNATYTYPRICISTVADYFESVRGHISELPVVRGDGGSYWEDGVGGAAIEMAAYRQAQSDLLAAETLAAVIGMFDQHVSPARGPLDDAWALLLYGAEHTWTSWHATRDPTGEQSVDQLDWKVHRIRSAAIAARDELRRAASQLGEHVAIEPPALVVFNPLSWARGGTIEVELPIGHALVDVGGEALPRDVLSRTEVSQRVRHRVPSLDAFGVRAWAVRPVPESSDDVPADWRPGLRASEGDDARRVPPTAELGPYVVGTDQRTGAVTSIVHAASGRELLDLTSRFGFADVVHVAGGTQGVDGSSAPGGRTSLHDVAPEFPRPLLDEVPATYQHVELMRRSASWVIRRSGMAPTVPQVDIDVEFHDDDDRIDVRVCLAKDRSYDKESVYVAFPLAVASDGRARMRYDRQQGWVDPASDHHSGACNEWFTTQHVVEFDGDLGAMTWVSADAPLFAVGDVVRGRWSETPLRSSTVLSWVMNNYWWTNFPASQAGELELRYALRPSTSSDLGSAARFGREVRQGLVATHLTTLDRFNRSGDRRLDANGTSLMDVDSPEHVAVTLHGSSRGDGDGVVVRAAELAGVAAVARVRHPDGAAGSAVRCLATEDELAPLAVDALGFVDVVLRPHEVATVRLARPSPVDRPGRPAERS